MRDILTVRCRRCGQVRSWDIISTATVNEAAAWRDNHRCRRANPVRWLLTVLGASNPAVWLFSFGAAMIGAAIALWLSR